MPATQGRVLNGPYGGLGGSYYNAEHGEHKIKKLDAWGRSYAGYDVLNGIQFTWDDNYNGPLIGHKNDNIHREFEFQDDEKINAMTVYAGDGEGFVNGLEFDTNRGRHYEVGGKEGKVNHLRNLGTGDWIGAEGRDNIHGASDVVDSMDIYFKT
ncbi:Jacalin-like lectin domain-containing protein [Aspergillus cavernicola]|uniref:Jacalin-like lectin domain-containing protein n=1 Tax=Aspergillus cavernicola TaxID=176166 RepID=A0ABR4ITG5_9EURO